jgi:hypothetical protein
VLRQHQEAEEEPTQEEAEEPTQEAEEEPTQEEEEEEPTQEEEEEEEPTQEEAEWAGNFLSLICFLACRSQGIARPTGLGCPSPELSWPCLTSRTGLRLPVRHRPSS